jgi:hypothetical protein
VFRSRSTTVSKLGPERLRFLSAGLSTAQLYQPPKPCANEDLFPCPRLSKSSSTLMHI